MSTTKDAMRGLPRAALLSNGRYRSFVRESGSGFSALGDLFLSRWRGDPVDDAEGWFVYLRDEDSGEIWSPGRQPAGGSPPACEIEFGDGRVVFRREDHGIGLELELCVAAAMDVEFRRLTLRNETAVPRRLRVVSYLEVALDTRAAFVAHPVFSSLFVTTSHLPEHRLVLASRRARGAGERPFSLAHWLIGRPGQEYGFETDRARFLGRWGELHAPRVVTAGTNLDGIAGNVLDPVLALDTGVELGPGARRSLAFGLGVARDPERLKSWAQRHRDPEGLEAEFEGARRQALERRRSGLHGELRRELQVLMRASPSPEPRVVDLDAVERGAAHEGVADATAPPRSELADPGPLAFDNGYGGFSEDGREYVIRVRPSRSQYPPLPWCNVIANEGFGFLVSERGSATTWSANSRENRITPWLNDPLADPHGEALYIEDRENGRLWSPTPGPIPDEGAYEVRHGFGYTRFRHHAPGLREAVLQYCFRHDPMKAIRITITNEGPGSRQLGLVCYLHLVMGSGPGTDGPRIHTERIEDHVLVASRGGEGEFAGRTAFLRALCERDEVDMEFTTDRVSFLGRGGRASRPLALLAAPPLDGRTGTFASACFALRVRLTLAPGETVRCAFLVGEARDRDQARSLARRYPRLEAVERAFLEVRDFWADTLAGVRVQTPDPGLDIMVNGWLAYQDLSCRMWGRSALYQSGGAYGFRDQLQDAAALLYLDPGLTRAQILRHAAHQFVEGDVLHWWHPPRGKGIRTRFSDDLLWLPYITAFYVERSGDEALLDETVRYIRARLLGPGEDEAYLSPVNSGRSGTVYEHCCVAIDRSLTTGAHDLPLMGTGDWNDGMNRVGRGGRGESVWLGFFLYHILERFIPICAGRGDEERVARYGHHRDGLREALNGPGWDGQWYRRAFYDDGTPLGSADNQECRIDAIAQAWAVISGVAPRERAERALDALETHLVDGQARIIRLLTPAFDRTSHDPGYIKGYVPGVRENGGQYTHGVLWAVRALAEFGRRDRAMQLMSMLNPIHHARDVSEVERYKVEPYVIAADVYGVSPHVGRGGWTWYTGSAGWMYRIVLESLLGLRLEGGQALVLSPRIPSEWPGFSLDYRLPDRRTRYHLVVENRGGAKPALRAATLDGAALSVTPDSARIPLAVDGQVHHVEVIVAGDADRPVPA